MNILREIAARARERVAEKKKTTSEKEIIEAARAAAPFARPFPFETALREADDIAFICEIKKASPSKGVIAECFPYLKIAVEYEAAGAAAISTLTEPFWFKGDDRYLKEISDAVSTPVLRKDFVVDKYMIYEARTLGAAAVLLICSLLDGGELEEYIGVSRELGICALVEARDEAEITRALAAGARIVGVNNRDLRTFEVDAGRSARLRKMTPPDVLFVAESGVKTPEDITRLREAGADAVLIGETLMRSPDKKLEISRLRGASL